MDFPLSFLVSLVLMLSLPLSNLMHAYNFPSPVGVDVKLNVVVPACIRLPPHFLLFTISQHSIAEKIGCLISRS
ncbi:hypothetical protein OUZ56_033635 [Daphnia magna]|uniref:Secreted protein n=1 Tax=Daphnia magna TaxID=35525 RepID=A0ABR0BAX3_9CRUS|nr:hypothetical protein OUZ56_033635 [Daphnia magna]